MPGDCGDVPGQFVRRLVDEVACGRIAALRDLIDDHRQRSDPGPLAGKAFDPALQSIDRRGPVETKMRERRIDKGRRAGAAIEALTDQTEGAPADPVAAAFVADDIAPAADTVGCAGIVARPGHRSGAGQDEDAGAAGKRTDMRAIDIVDDRLRDAGESFGDDGALGLGDMVDLAMGRKGGTDRGQSRLADEGCKLASRGPPASSDCPTG